MFGLLRHKSYPILTTPTVLPSDKLILIAVLAFYFLLNPSSCLAQRQIPEDLSHVRGFNYTPANVAAMPRHHIDHWLSYSKETTEFDLDLAVRLKLNQVRVFVPYQVYVEDKEGLRDHLLHFVRACHEREIGVMPVVGRTREWVMDESRWTEAREWAEFLVDTLGDEPGLAFWDVMNEPDGPGKPPEVVKAGFEYAKFMSGVFHELDKKTPVTIGMTFVPGMEELADYMDVLSFHDYSPTRGQIRANIERAKAFAKKVGKPVFDTEMGCIARTNPYDITLEEHMDADMGWYIWELMIVRRGWGKIHGVFYEDGTVRDPAIAAAIMGFFRNRGENIVISVPDQEGRVTGVLKNGRKWLDSVDAQANPPSQDTWNEGLGLAEQAANLLEAGQRVAMYDPPTRRVALLRKNGPDMKALKALLTELLDLLEPCQLTREDKD